MFTMGPPLWGGGGDPLFSSVLALMHFDDGSGATSPFVDSSLYAGTQSAPATGLSGTTTDVKYGASAVVRANAAGITAVGKSPGSVQWLTRKALPGGAQTNVPITLEGWVLFPGGSTASCDLFRVALSASSGSGNHVGYNISYRGTGGGGTVEFACTGSAGLPFAVTTVARPTDGLFHHWAICVTPGGNALCFLDGALIGTKACATHASFGFVEVSVGSGNEFGDGPLIVYDECRVTQAIRYAGAFTPAGPFPGA